MKDLAGKFIGDRRFYRRAMTVALPIMLQNVVTNFVNLLDNVMVGQTGTASMSGGGGGPPGWGWCGCGPWG